MGVGRTDRRDPQLSERARRGQVSGTRGPVRHSGGFGSVRV